MYRNLLQGVAEEVVGSGVRFNILCPTRTATQLLADALANEPSSGLLVSTSVTVRALALGANLVPGIRGNRQP